jgi:hypothetical protein
LQRYFVIMRRGGVLAVGGAGEMAKVSQVFQPCARFCAANSP